MVKKFFMIFILALAALPALAEVPKATDAAPPKGNDVAPSKATETTPLKENDAAPPKTAELPPQTPEEARRAICTRVAGEINKLDTGSKTRCFPTKVPQPLSLAIVSQRRNMLADETAKRIWLLNSVAVVGKAMNENLQLETGDIGFVDMDLIKERKWLVLPISLAKELQKKSADGQIDLNKMYDSIQSASKISDLPK